MDNTFDKMFYGEGEIIAGIDESGVSDIAGPLVAACVILPRIDIHKDDLRIFEIDDSKKIPKRFRKKYAEIVWQTADAIGIGEVSPQEFNYYGVHISIKMAMMRAIAACRKTNIEVKVKPDLLLIDGKVNLPPQVGIKSKKLVKGDTKSLSIAAASIVAKVYRDEIMESLHEKYPYYDWCSNKGYLSDKHLDGLDNFGIIPHVHRTAYWPFSSNLHCFCKRMDGMSNQEKFMWKNRRQLWRKKTIDNEVRSLWTTEKKLKKDSIISTNSDQVQQQLH